MLSPAKHLFLTNTVHIHSHCLIFFPLSHCHGLLTPYHNDQVIVLQYTHHFRSLYHSTGTLCWTLYTNRNVSLRCIQFHSQMSVRKDKKKHSSGIITARRQAPGHYCGNQENDGQCVLPQVTGRDHVVGMVTRMVERSSPRAKLFAQVREERVSQRDRLQLDPQPPTKTMIFHLKPFHISNQVKNHVSNQDPVICHNPKESSSNPLFVKHCSTKTPIPSHYPPPQRLIITHMCNNKTQ